MISSVIDIGRIEGVVVDFGIDIRTQFGRCLFELSSPDVVAFCRCCLGLAIEGSSPLFDVGRTALGRLSRLRTQFSRGLFELGSLGVVAFCRCCLSLAIEGSSPLFDVGRVAWRRLLFDVRCRRLLDVGPSHRLLWRSGRGLGGLRR